MNSSIKLHFHDTICKHFTQLYIKKKKQVITENQDLQNPKTKIKL